MIPLVFCVDDDSIALFISKINLKKSNFCQEIISFENSYEALNYFENQIQLTADLQKIPNLIFLDLSMPGMDGWEFIDIFEEKYQIFKENILIILLSSTSNPADKLKAEEHPMIYALLDKANAESNLNFLKTLPKISAYF
jgi:CheY-like chemotaxis protein